MRFGFGFLCLLALCLARESLCPLILSSVFADAHELFPAPDEPPSPPAALRPEWWKPPPASPPESPCGDAGTCVACHRDTASMDARHAFACTVCHKGDSTAKDKETSHRTLITHPGNLERAGETCGACHADVVRKVKGSAMALAPRMINHTRFAFGAQKDPRAIYGVASDGGMALLPEFPQSGELVDDLLRRACLRCHLRVKSGDRPGEHRGEGCAACHFAVPNNKTGKPRRHALVRNAGTTVCLKCHNSNHVGADFVGLYEKDFDRGFRSPLVGGRAAPRIYGAEQHRLTPDAHYRAGMTCSDCHSLAEIHGTGDVCGRTLPGVTVRCADCHVTAEHSRVRESPDGWVLSTSRGERKIPRWRPNGSAHKIEAHVQRVACSACHAGWSFQDYGFHLMLEERADYWKWSHLAGWNDPQIQDLLQRNIGTEAELIPPIGGAIAAKPMEDWSQPASRDLLSGRIRPGAWFGAFTARLWSDPPLGLDHTGKVTVFRPMRQYVISRVDENENLLLDREIPVTGAGAPALLWNPYAPHTIASVGRPCQGCHGSPKALGLGEGMMGSTQPGLKPLWRNETKIPGREFRWDAMVDESGAALQASSRPGAGPLDHATLKKLMNPSDLFKRRFHEFLAGGRARTLEQSK